MSTVVVTKKLRFLKRYNHIVEVLNKTDESILYVKPLKMNGQL